jgi:hypothetical protein
MAAAKHRLRPFTATAALGRARSGRNATEAAGCSTLLDMKDPVARDRTAVSINFPLLE